MADKTKPAGERAGQQHTPIPDTVADPGLSTQAHFSTYRENTDLPDANPKPGRHVVQELGRPKKM